MKSFRDPAGHLRSAGRRILRVVNDAGAADLNAFLASQAARELLASGRMVATRTLDASERAELVPETEAAAVVLEHERVPFPSYPYEWPPEMLLEASRLTLDVARMLLDQGMGLKDATPYNVLFRGPRPTFIDVLSVERRDALDQTWLPYAQFVRTFILPLLANKHFGIPLRQVFETARDGLEPEAVYRLCGPLRRLGPPFLTLVTLPTWLAARRDGYDPGVYRNKPAASPEQARFVLNYLFQRLGRLLDQAAPTAGRASTWSAYATSPPPEQRQEEFAAKRDLVESVMSEFGPKTVLDVGCNTGYLSAVAARRGARVVAIDADPVVVAAAWRRAAAENLDILPLVVDLTRPSPAVGWRNAECPAFLERAQGAFDAVFLFAVIHHLLVGERVPLPEILDLAAELITEGGLAVIEFVPPEDPLFRRIARGRDALFAGLTAEGFEATARQRFEIVRAAAVPGTSRTVYLLRKR